MEKPVDLLFKLGEKFIENATLLAFACHELQLSRDELLKRLNTELTDEQRNHLSVSGRQEFGEIANAALDPETAPQKKVQGKTKQPDRARSLDEAIARYTERMRQKRLEDLRGMGIKT